MAFKVYAQRRFGEKPMEVFDTSKSVRLNDPNTKKKDHEKAADDFITKYQGETNFGYLMTKEEVQ